MNFSKLTDDLAIISKLGDNPGADNGLTAEGLKAKFDEAALILQAYLNGELVEKLNEIFAGGDSKPNDGLNMIGPINMNGNPLQNLRDPASPGEAISLGYALAHFLDGNRKINGKPLSEDIVLNAYDVGARPATWLPTPAELGAAPESHVADKNNPHEVTCEQIGATSMTLLWENASPTSEFAAQTIALDLSGYDGVKIVRTEKANTEANRGVNGTSHMIVDAQVSYINYEGSIQVIFLQRDYTPSDTGIKFKDCKQCGYYAGSWGKGELRNDLMKPLKIYGIKGVIE